MRRSPLVVMSAVLAFAALTGCSDDGEEKAAPGASGAANAQPTVSLDVPTGAPANGSKPGLTEGTREAGEALRIEATGGGPYEVGETQADLTESGLLGNPVDNGGCVTATGTGLFGSPEVYLSQGKVVMVKAAKDDPRIGTPLTDVQAQFPEGKAVSGSGGAQGWEVVEETNSLLFVATGGTVSAVAGGVSASVTKNFTAGSGC